MTSSLPRCPESKCTSNGRRAMLSIFSSQLQSFTPLYLAALNGHSEAVEVLLAAGADPNSTTVSARTAETSLNYDITDKIYPIISLYYCPGLDDL